MDNQGRLESVVRDRPAFCLGADLELCFRLLLLRFPELTLSDFDMTRGPKRAGTPECHDHQHAERIIEVARQWARAQKNILAVALVGSYARKTRKASVRYRFGDAHLRTDIFSY
jgi:hypothetical protein